MKTQRDDLIFNFENREIFEFLYDEIFIHKTYQCDLDREDPVIFDCGGNIGMSTLFFKQQYPNAKIKSRVKRIAQYLEENGFIVENRGVDMGESSKKECEEWSKETDICVENLYAHKTF